MERENKREVGFCVPALRVEVKDELGNAEKIKETKSPSLLRPRVKRES
jgi:hypothetical protein